MSAQNAPGKKLAMPHYDQFALTNARLMSVRYLNKLPSLEPYSASGRAPAAGGGSPKTECTRVLFAFGGHSSAQEDKDFFRSSVVPFLEEQVLLNGFPVTIIHESCFYDRLSSILDAPAQRRQINGSDFQKALESQERRVLQRMADTLDKGLPMPELHNWGFLDAIIALNGICPGSVTNLVEHHSPQAAMDLLREDVARLGPHEYPGTPAKASKLVIERILGTVEAMKSRDNAVIEQLREIAGKRPNCAIVVPRGSAHFPMARRVNGTDKGISVEIERQAQTGRFDPNGKNAMTLRFGHIEGRFYSGEITLAGLKSEVRQIVEAVFDSARGAKRA